MPAQLRQVSYWTERLSCSRRTRGSCPSEAQVLLECPRARLWISASSVGTAVLLTLLSAPLWGSGQPKKKAKFPVGDMEETEDCCGAVSWTSQGWTAVVWSIFYTPALSWSSEAKFHVSVYHTETTNKKLTEKEIRKYTVLLRKNETLSNLC